MWSCFRAPPLQEKSPRDSLGRGCPQRVAWLCNEPPKTQRPSSLQTHTQAEEVGGIPPKKTKHQPPAPFPLKTPPAKKKRGCPPPCATLLGALARVSFPLCPGDPGGRPGPGAAVYFLACNYNLPKLHGILWIIVSELFLFPTNVALQMWKQPWRRARGEEERGEGKKGEKE